MVAKKSTFAILLFLLVFSFGLIWASTVPVGEAPDEDQHLAMILFLRQEKRLPIFDQEDRLAKMNFFPQLITDKFQTGAYYSQAQNSPLSYSPFLPFATDYSIVGKSGARVISSLFIALFASFLFLALCNFGAKKTLDSAVATIFIALIPQVLFSAGYVNIEPIGLFLSALAFYFASRIYAGRNQLKDFLYCGVSFGLLALCKVNYLFLALFLFAWIVGKIILAKASNRGRLYSLAMVVTPILALCSWWWLRNLRLYGDPIISNYINNKVLTSGPEWFLPPVKAGYNILTIIFQPDFARNTFLGFFAALGKLDVFLPAVFYFGFYIIVIALIIMALKSTWHDRKKGSFWLAVSILVLFLINLLIFAKKNLIDFSPQGRHLFPMLVPLAVLIYFGLVSIKNIFWKYLILAFSLVSALWALIMLYFKYKDMGASIRENSGALSVSAVTIYLSVFLLSISITILFFIRNQKSQINK